MCSETFNLLGNKKYFCKFCFRGVCGKCSIHKGLSPITQAPERICDNCFNKGLEDQVKFDYEIEITKEKEQQVKIESEMNEAIELKGILQSKIIEIKLKTDVLHQKMLEEDNKFANIHIDVSDEIRNFNNEVEESTDKLERVLEQVNGIRQNIQNGLIKIEKLKSIQNSARLEKVDIKSKIKEFEKHNADIKEFLIILVAKEAQEDNNVDEKQAENELINKVQRMTEQLDEAKRENNNLKRKLDFKRDDFNNKQYLLEHPDKIRIEAEAENEQVKLLIEKSESQKLEIIQLQHKINQNSKIQEMVDKDHKPPEPEVTKCKCNVQ